MVKNMTTPTLATEEPPYNPDGLESVENFWQGSRIEHQAKAIGVSRRIKDCEPVKVQATVTLSLREMDFLKTSAKTGKRV